MKKPKPVYNEAEKQGEVSREKMEIGTKYNKNNECCGELENS